MRTILFATFAALILIGFGAGPAFSIEPSDGGIYEEDQDPEFNDSDAFDEIDALEGEDAAGIDEEADTPARVRKVGIVGIWQYTDRHSGWFAAKLFVKVRGKRVLVGRLKGIFKHTQDGAREMAGVILDRKGNYRGKLKGVYKRGGWIARWTVKGGDRVGKAKARFIVPFGRAGFVGTAVVPRGELDTDES
jgi:hypothetical protein